MGIDRTVIGQLGAVWAELAALGHQLSDEEWAAPTECPGWSVADNLAHLLGTESVLAGRPNPPAVEAPYVKNPIGELNEAWVGSWRGRPPAELLAAFEAVTAERLATLEAMTDEELERPGPSPIGQVPYATFMEVRLMDCWVHEQDMRRAVGRPGDEDSPAAEVSIDRLLGSLGVVVGKRAAAPEGATVVLELTGPVERVRGLVVVGGRAQLAGATAAPTVHLRTDSQTFVRLNTGRLAGREAEAQGLVTLDGDTELGHRVLDNLAAMI